MPRTPKTRTVLVKCLVVDSDGYAVNGHGEPLKHNQKPFYEWDKRRRPTAWLAAHPEMWKEVPRG